MRFLVDAHSIAMSGRSGGRGGGGGRGRSRKDANNGGRGSGRGSNRGRDIRGLRRGSRGSGGRGNTQVVPVHYPALSEQEDSGPTMKMIRMRWRWLLEEVMQLSRQQMGWIWLLRRMWTVDGLDLAFEEVDGTDEGLDLETRRILQSCIAQSTHGNYEDALVRMFKQFYDNLDKYEGNFQA